MCWPLSTRSPVLGVGERRGAAAKSGARFEHEHAGAAIGQRGGGAEPGAPAADHDGIEPVHALAERRSPIADSWDRAQMVSAMRARTNFGTRITSVKTS